MKTLTDLITEASLLIGEISVHPDYEALIEKGYFPDLTVGDAYTALVYLNCEIDRKTYPETWKALREKEQQQGGEGG